jgi:hypothetical protein
LLIEIGVVVVVVGRVGDVGVESMTEAEIETVSLSRRRCLNRRCGS